MLYRERGALVNKYVVPKTFALVAGILFVALLLMPAWKVQPAGAQAVPAAQSEAQAACGVSYSHWAAEPALPTGRNNAMGVAINDKLYVLGGYNSNFSVAADLYRLDTSNPASGWQSMTPMPLRVIGAQAVSLGGKIYVTGGYSGTNPVASVQVYEPGANTWSSAAPLPVALGGMAATAYNGKIYIFGGAGADDQPTNAVYEYDPATGISTPKNPMPAPVYNAAAAVLNNRIYVVGGSSYSYANFVYNPATDQWLGIAPSPRTTTDKTGLLSLGGELWALGGSYSGQEAPGVTVQIYSPLSNTWRYGPAFLSQRTWTSAATVIGNTAYVAGGFAQDRTASAAVEAISYSGVPCSLTCPIAYPDVPLGSPFYAFVQCLSCRSILSGYSNGNFGPGDLIKRGQLSKVVANAAGYSDDPGAQRFQDVPPGGTFYPFVNRLASRGMITGYACGGPGEPCGAGNLPYYRPNSNASRGQITKIVVLASPLATLPYDSPSGAGAAEGKAEPDSIPPPPPPFFADVPLGSPFYDTVQKLARFNVVGGYACGGAGEPCSQAGGKPYFRPGSNATRGQIAKIVSNAFYPACDAP